MKESHDRMIVEPLSSSSYCISLWLRKENSRTSTLARQESRKRKRHYPFPTELIKGDEATRQLWEDISNCNLDALALDQSIVVFAGDLRLLPSPFQHSNSLVNNNDTVAIFKHPVVVDICNVGDVFILPLLCPDEE